MRQQELGPLSREAGGPISPPPPSESSSSTSESSSSTALCRETWACKQCTSDNPLDVSTCELCAARRSTPVGIVGAVAMGSVMLLCSPLLTFSLGPGPVIGAADVRRFLEADAHAVENVGHAGLVVIFAGMYWLAGKLYCWYMLHLSSMFMTLVSGMSLAAAGTAVALPRNYDGFGVVPLVTSLVFLFGCAACVWSLFYDMDGKRNFSLRDSRSAFPAALLDGKHNDPRRDAPTVTCWARRLHLCLLCQVGVLAVTVVLRGIACALDVKHQQHDLAAMFSAPVWTAGFVESFTMIFHRCFILSTGFAGMMRGDDTLEMFGHGTLVFACFSAVRATRGFIMTAAPSSLSGGFSVMPFWWGQHVEPSINVVTKTVTLYVVYRLRRAMATATARMNETNGGNGVATSAANRTWRLPRATIFSFRSTRARLVACSASLLAVTWQGQAVYMLLNERGKAATASQVDAETVFSAFNSAVNFSMHGAAFFLFHTVLSFQSRAAYSRLRELHILAGAFAGVYSFALCSHLYFFRSSRSPGNDASSLIVLMVVRGVVCWFYALAFTLYSPEDLDADQEDYDIRVRFRLDEGDAREVYSAVSLGASKLGHDDDDDGGGDVGNLDEPRKASVDGHDEDILLRTAGKVGTPCPADIATRIDLRGKHGQVAVILAGSVWSLYVILMNIVLFQPSLIRDKGRTMTRVAVHPLGFGITFHAAYLMTLFGWHGFFTGNLVTLDVGRNFALSTLILTVVLAILVPSVGWLALSMGLASLLVVVLSTMYANLSSKWSTDPLKTWRR